MAGAGQCIRQEPRPVSWLADKGLVYLATPYSKYPAGIEQAFRDASALTAKIMLERVKVYSPIVHTHPMAIHGDVNPLDHSLWLPFDQAMMEKSDSLLVAMLDSWESSYGIAHEQKVFSDAGKPVYFLNPKTLEMTQ